MTAQCGRCGKPMADQAYACHGCAQGLAEALRTAAGHAEDAETVIARQARYGAGGRGGSSESLPVDLTASARYGAAANAIGTWARVVHEESGAEPEPWRPTAGPVCAPRRPADGPPLPGKPWLLCAHPSCEAIRRPRPPAVTEACLWLAGQTGWLRRHPAAGEAFADLERACRALARLVDRPADKELVGRCDCGARLYAHRDQAYVTCAVATCKLRWNVAESREILLAALRTKLFTASECAHWAAFWTDRTQPQVRALITTWTRPDRHRLEARGWIPNDDYTGDGDEPQGWHTYLLGDVLDLLAQTPRRERKREGAAA